MKALVAQNGKIDYREIGLDPLPYAWARVKVLRAGLCGTDVAKFSAAQLPEGHTSILGHEFVGRLEEVNDQEHRFVRGDIVTGITMLACGTCWPCTQGRQNLCLVGTSIGRTNPGAFAEYVDVPVRNLIELPSEGEHDPYTLANPLAVCVHALRQMSTITGQKCLVIGDGTIGVLMGWLLQRSGNDTSIMGTHQQNLAFAKTLGLRAFDTEQEGENYDAVFEAVGRQQEKTLDLSLRSVRPGGQIVVLGVYAFEYYYPLNARSLFIREIQLRGSKGYVPNDFAQSVSLIGENLEQLSGFISHRFLLAEAVEALTQAREKHGFTMKIIFTLDAGSETR